MVKASLLFYSKQDKFIPNTAKIGKLLPFIAIGRDSTNDRGNDREMTYIWRVVRGVFPSIVNMSENGSVVFFNAPDKNTQIEIELKVVDIITNNSDTASIVIDVTD